MSAYKHILVATDFSEPSKAAIRRGAALAHPLNARLTLLHVLAYFPEDEPNDLIPPEDVDPAEFQQRRRREQLAALAKEVGCENAELQLVPSTHSARHEIARFAKEHKADLIVLGSHTYHRVADWFSSNPDELVYSAPCDVLVVRSSK